MDDGNNASPIVRNAKRAAAATAVLAAVYAASQIGGGDKYTSIPYKVKSGDTLTALARDEGLVDQTDIKDFIERVMGANDGFGQVTEGGISRRLIGRDGKLTRGLTINVPDVNGDGKIGAYTQVSAYRRPDQRRGR